MAVKSAYIREYREFHPICAVCQPNLDPLVDPAVHPFTERAAAEIVLSDHVQSTRHKEALRLRRKPL